MGAGFARQLRELHPWAYKNYVEQRMLTLGDIYPVWEEPIYNEGMCIVNAITQGSYGYKGRYVSYDAVDECMMKLNEFMHAKEYTEVSMPMIGAGLGGGSWDVVSKIIDHRLSGLKVIVYYLKDERK